MEPRHGPACRWDFLLHRGEQSWACLLLDLHMPSVNGVETLQLLRDTVSLPVLTMSGDSSPDLRRDAMRLGAVRHLNKPLDEAVLVEALLLATRGRPD